MGGAGGLAIQLRLVVVVHTHRNLRRGPRGTPPSCTLFECIPSTAQVCICGARRLVCASTGSTLNQDSRVFNLVTSSARLTRCTFAGAWQQLRTHLGSSSETVYS